MEEGLGWCEVEAVRSVREMRAGEADVIFAEKGGEAHECVGKPVRLADATLEEIVLATGGLTGGEGDFQAGDGGPEGELLKMGGEGAKKDFERVAGFRKPYPVMVLGGLLEN